MDCDDGLDKFKHPDVVHTIPTMRDLDRYIVPKYAAKWKVLGILLGLHTGTLGNIQYNRFECQDCCRNMLEVWVRDHSATWKSLFTALESLAITGKDIPGQLRVSAVDDGKLEQFKHPDKANSRPLMGDLNKYFIPQYAAKWEMIGILLGLKPYMIKGIKGIKGIDSGFSNFCIQACKAMLQKWLDVDITASWAKLFNAIKSPAMTSMLDQSSMSEPLGYSDINDEGLQQFQDPNKVDTEPSLKDLYEHITPRYAAYWKEIGILLGLTTGRLDIIGVDYPLRVEDRCNQMLQYWLEQDPTASWGRLLTVIESLPVSSKVSDKEMFKKLYYQAKHDLGTEELQLYKLVIFGPPGVGKSSLFQVLLGNNPNPVRSSTGVLYRKLVQVKVAITTFADQSKSSWHLVSIENEILRLRSTIKGVIDKPKQLHATLPAAMDVTSDSTVNVANDSNRSEMKVEEKLFQPSTEVPTHVEYTSTLMACYDSGGQPEFFDIMPALMTIPTGNIMVFDMSEDINLNIKSEFYEEGKSSGLQHQAHYTTAELMKTAIANIQSYSNHDSTASSDSGTSRLLVVGTHLDLCGQTVNEKLQTVTKIEASLCNDVLAGGAVQMVYSDSDGRIIHPISNTDHEGRDEAAQKIRTAIEHMSKYHKSYSQVPINWLLFQLEVQLTGKDYVGRSECIDIAKHCYIKENEVDYVLMYFHQLGILLHYREVKGLKDIIFCNPQWLFDQLTELIKVKYNAPPLIQQDINKGIFHKQRLFDIYSKKLDAKGQLKFENLLELFTHLNIMSVLPNKPDQYFMPALLNPAPTDIPLQEEYGVQVHDAMLVKFKHRYFPRGMFCCLVTHLAQNNWMIQVKHAYKNLVVCQIVPDYYVALFDKINHMAVAIHCKKESKPQGSHCEVYTHYDVCDTLYKGLRKLCKMFQMNCDFKFGFPCKECRKFAGVKLQYPFSTNCICKKCQRSYQLNHDQLVWFIPPHFLVAQVSTVQQSGRLSNEDIVGPSRKQQKKASENLDSILDEIHFNKTPDMCDLIMIVIPKIQAEWEEVAYFLRYDVATVKAIKEDCRDSKKCCRKLFEDWLSSSRGVTPKTWSKLLERIKAIDSLEAASEDIEKKLISMFKEQCS